MTHEKTVLLLGGIIIDRYYLLASYPEKGQDTIIHDTFDKIGGCALNVAITLSNLGTTSHIVSQLGDDEAGRKIYHYLESHDLPTDCIEHNAEKATGYCLTMVDPAGERTFFTFLGCQGDFTQHQISAHLPSSISCVYLTGYFLAQEKTAEEVLHFLQKLKAQTAGPLLVFDPGPLVQNIKTDMLLAIITLADWILPNNHELDLLAKIFAIEGDPVAWLHNKGCRNVIVKHGSQGATAHLPGQTVTRPSFTIQVKETSGAGDSFAGGLISALLNQVPLEKALDFAGACGAYTAMTEGPHTTFTKQTINHFIECHKDKKHV